MIPAILLNIFVSLLVTTYGIPKVVLTKNEHDANKNEEVVHLMM